jgi:diguanylate cyclase (GGDEF)-like protein
LNKEQVFVRFGGEEFIIVTPKMNKAQATAFAAELNNNARELKLIHEDHEIIVNMSIGIYVTDNLSQFIDKMIDKADIALYEAKDQGRDCFVFYTDK